MDAKEARRAWVVRLLASKYADNRAAMASATGIARTQISQVVSGARQLGDVTARRAEEKLGYPRGTFDRPPGELAQVPVMDGDKLSRAEVELLKKLRRNPKLMAALSASLPGEEARIDLPKEQRKRK